MKIDMSVLKLYLKILFIMALGPIGMLASFVLTDSSSLEIQTRGSVMHTALPLVFLSVTIIIVLAIIGKKTTDMKKHTFFQWISIISWLPVGIIPGIAGFGWKYAVGVTVLPSITIYYLFHWGKEVARNKKEKSNSLVRNNK